MAVIEAISFKLGLNLLNTFSKSKLTARNIRVDFYDKDTNTHEYLTFANLAEYNSFFLENYQRVDWCVLGDLSGIQSMYLTSEVYNFTTTYTLSNVLDNYTLQSGRDFDLQRDLLRQTLQNRQIAAINEYINLYLTSWRRLSYAYPRVYSPCYAEPGWSEQTGLIFNLKQYLYLNSDLNAEDLASAVRYWIPGFGTV